MEGLQTQGQMIQGMPIQGQVLTANNSRVRMNMSISAKGAAQWDVTAEFDTPEHAAENLSKAIDAVRAIIARKGLTEAKA
jgi:translation initiation factor 2 alpha subunit (eIF-2alpha)